MGKRRVPQCTKSQKLKEIQASITKFQHRRWHNSTGSTAIFNRDDLKANSLLIREIRVMVLACKRADSKIRHTTAKLSTMKPHRPLISTAKSFHQATPDPYSHIYKHTQILTTQTQTLSFNITQLKALHVTLAENILNISTFNKV